MDFEQRITAMMKDAMKARDKLRLEALRAVKSVILTERTKSSEALSEARAIQAIASYRKKMANAVDQYREANRPAMAEAAEVEIAVCDELLPQRLSDDELAAVVDEVIAETGASSPADMGKVMGPLMKRLAGRADGAQAKTLVMQRLKG